MGLKDLPWDYKVNKRDSMNGNLASVILLYLDNKHSRRLKEQEELERQNRIKEREKARLEKQRLIEEQKQQRQQRKASRGVAMVSLTQDSNGVWH